MHDVVIVGAGPAGMAAAVVLAENGVRPVLVDEADRPGGQAWRQPSAPIHADKRRLLGRAGAADHDRAHAAFAAIAPRIDLRSRCLAWNIHDGEVYLAEGTRVTTLRPRALLLATGATDRLLPVPGWTLPGVFSLGGAQTLLKDQGAAIGRRVVFAGASPLLYLAALQYRAMGVDVAAVLDTTRFADKLSAGPALVRAAPRTLARGIGWMARLRAAGVPILDAVADIVAVGTERIEGVTFVDGARAKRQIACDALALGFGLRCETQLAELAGAELRFDPVFRQWLPVTDPDGRCRTGLYAAGDGCRIGGAEAAEIGGRLAAWAILADGGRNTPARERSDLRRRLGRLRDFQHGLARAFAWPAERLAVTPDDTMLCRCEGVTLGALRAALARPLGPTEVNRAKAATRCGMGRCQGRYCGPAMTEALAQTLRVPIEGAGRLRAQAPVKPIPLEAVLEEPP